MRKEDVQYSIGDLTRALLREYLTQKGLKKTMQAFEKEDLSNKKKISKNLLIEMVSLKSLFLLNKQTQESQSSLLEILVSYLNRKYQQKKNNFITTQPNFSNQKLIDGEQAQKAQGKYTAKERPVSSKPFKSNEIDARKTSSHPLREKQELKGIYQKIVKKEDSKQFRIVEANASKKIEPAKVEQKEMKRPGSARKSQTLQNKLPQPEQQYNDCFQEEEQLPKESLRANFMKEKQIIPIESEKKIKKDELVITIKSPEQMKQIIQNIKEQKKNEPIQSPIVTIQNEKEPQLPIKDKITTFQQKKSQVKLSKNISQQNLNPTPIVHIQSKPQQIQTNTQIKIGMGCCAQIPQAKPKPELTKIEQRPQPAKVQPEPLPQKNRTEMRMIKKERDSSSKFTEVPQLKKQAEKQPKKQEPIQKQIPKIESQKSDKNQNEVSIPKREIEINKKIEPQTAAAPVMVTIGKKKKTKQQTSEQNYPTKFKFDQNFTHQIPKEIIYEYKEYSFEPIVINENASQLLPSIVLNSQINYKQKGGGAPPIKKRMEKIIASKDAQRLKKSVFQSSPPVLPKSWAQGFILSPNQQTPYGLKQIQGGPCGIIAALQCYFLKHLLFCSQQSDYKDDTIRQVCLVAAIANMLWKVKSTDKFLLAFPPKGASKVEISNLRTVTIDANDFTSAFAGIWSVRDQYIGNSNHGVASLLYSVVLTKGIDLIEGEVDIKENPLIGNHGHCTQEFVNLVLTGKATSNCFDGQKILDDDYKLKGIPEKSQFGFLTVFETLKYIQVGKNLKNPIFPVWVICKEFHYHVIFAPNYLISQNNKTPKFDIVYFDGLYNCGDRIRITLQSPKQEDDGVKLKDLPLIEQVMMTKWGRKVANWNGSTRIL